MPTPWLSYSWWRIQGDLVIELRGASDRVYAFTYATTFGGKLWTAKLETTTGGEYAGATQSSSGQTRHAVYDRAYSVVEAASPWLEVEAGAATLELELVKSELITLLSITEQWTSEDAIKGHYPGAGQDHVYLLPDSTHMEKFLKDVADYWDREARSLKKGHA